MEKIIESPQRNFPTINEKLKELFGRVRFVVNFHEELYYVAGITSPFDALPMRDPQFLKRASCLKFLSSATTYHVGRCNPSAAEILAEIPAEYQKEVSAIEVVLAGRSHGYGPKDESCIGPFNIDSGSFYYLYPYYVSLRLYSKA